MEACPCCTSLMQMCMWELIKNTPILERSVPYLPSRVHCLLFTEAAILSLRLGRNVRNSILALVSKWPKEIFCIMKLLPEKQIQSILNGGSYSLLDVIIEGLLHLDAESNLAVVDFRGIYAPSLFQLPILSMDNGSRACDSILKAVRKKYECLLREAGEEWINLEAVIKWKLAEIRETNTQSRYQGKGNVDIRTECHLNLSDWLGIDDEIVGLAIHDQTPFRLKVTKLSVDNYHKRQVGLLKGFMDVVDIQELTNLVIYGKRGGVNVVLWDMAEYFEKLINLTMFGMGTSGLKLQYRYGNEPAPDQIFDRASVTFSKWTQLNEVYIVGVVLSGQIHKFLSALPNPLQKVILYSCSLVRSDIEYLSDCKHLAALNELGLEYNNLKDMGELMCTLVNKSPNLHILNLKETWLKPDEKLSLVYTLQNCSQLDTLVLFEKEDFLSLEAYETILEVACLIDSLREIYIFPFDYKPFEMFYKPAVDQAVEEILTVNERQNLNIFY